MFLNWLANSPSGGRHQLDDIEELNRLCVLTTVYELGLVGNTFPWPARGETFSRD